MPDALPAHVASPIPRPSRRPSRRLLTALGLTVAGGSALAALLVARRRRRATLPARAMIVSPRKSTSIAHDGGVTSVQSAQLTVSAADLERLWTARNLENLARTYWVYLTRATLGFARIRYTPTERRVTLLGIRRLTLLRFEAPEYEFEGDHGRVTWRIRDGLLVTRAGRGSGHLQLDVRRLPETVTGEGLLRIEVEVSNFYPSIAAGLSTPVYEMTQSFIHVLVTNGFLRSLAALELHESHIGALAPAQVPGAA
jgi:hypothetical protein